LTPYVDKKSNLIDKSVVAYYFGHPVSDPYAAPPPLRFWMRAAAG